MICEKCGTPIPEGSEVCPNCAQLSDNFFPDAVEAPKKKSHLGLFLGLGAVAVLAIAAIVVGVMTDWFGLNGPMAQMRRAAMNTGEINSMALKLSVDADALSTDLLGVSINDITCTVEIDPAEKKLELLAETEIMGVNLVVAIHDNMAYLGEGSNFDTIDLSESLNEFWDSYGKANKDEKLDLFELLKNADIEDEVDLETLRVCTQTLLKHMNNSAWLTENFGYNKSNELGQTHYRFFLPIEKAVNAVLADLEPAFKDPTDLDEVRESLKAATELENFDVIIDFGVADNKLNSLSFVIDVEANKVEMVMDSFNTAKVDVARLEEIAAKASQE